MKWAAPPDPTWLVVTYWLSRNTGESLHLVPITSPPYASVVIINKSRDIQTSLVTPHAYSVRSHIHWYRHLMTLTSVSSEHQMFRVRDKKDNYSPVPVHWTRLYYLRNIISNKKKTVWCIRKTFRWFEGNAKSFTWRNHATPSKPYEYNFHLTWTYEIPKYERKRLLLHLKFDTLCFLKEKKCPCAVLKGV